VYAATRYGDKEAIKLNDYLSHEVLREYLAGYIQTKLDRIVSWELNSFAFFYFDDLLFCI
jgi:hypothetical protein